MSGCIEAPQCPRGAGGSGEQRQRWRTSEAVGAASDADIRLWARRLCVTPGELREMLEEVDLSLASRPFSDRRASTAH